MDAERIVTECSSINMRGKSTERRAKLLMSICSSEFPQAI
ncbi:MAG: hypothetical protein DMG47_18800 [Acidobacteria bacterium]|nr:MAG: hypothetical protein DMG47_18800 [Acidobacteriota bacterium]PYT56489.1 MAG: hypothetical protein DMG46_17555 [Acidobacteriota bacterium]